MRSRFESKRALGWHRLQLVTAALALACGGGRGGTAAPGDVSGSALPDSAPTRPDSTLVPSSAPEVAAATAQATERAPIDAMLGRECGACHAGPSASRDAFLDLEMLIANGWLLPGSAETSSLMLWLQYGDARREHAGVHISADEFAAFAGYLNALNNPEHCLGDDLVDRDRAQALLLADISSRAEADRPFIRYVGSTPTNEPEGCEAHPEGRAFQELVNGLSLRPEIVAPELIAGDALGGAPIYAIDIRDYGWDAPIGVDGLAPGVTRSADRWSAIAAVIGPYALELAGPEADALKREAQTPVPFLPAGALVAAAAVGPLYYALVGVGENAGTLARSLGVDAGAAARAGIFGAEPAPDRVITRRAQAAFPGLSWWTREELPQREARLASDPVSYLSEGSEVIFALPNGLFGFAIAAADGAAIGGIPSCMGGLPCPTVQRAESSITCRGCHSDGLIGVRDEVLPYLDADPARYAPELSALIREWYGADLQAAADADSAQRAAAQQAATGSAHSGDVIGRAFYRFTSRTLGARQLADELGVALAALEPSLARLRPEAPGLAPLLAGGRVERSRVDQHFAALACEVGGQRNMPVGCPRATSGD